MACVASVAFAHIGPQLREAGFAVIPAARDRKPKIAGFSEWKTAPSHRTIAQWASKHGDSEAAMFVPALSAGGLVVLDVDNIGDLPAVIEIFGDTSVRVFTRRGVHLFYRAPKGLNLGKLTNLREYGLEVDVKWGRHLCVAPGSLHKSGEHVYSATVPLNEFSNAPLFDVNALNSFRKAATSGGWSSPRSDSESPIKLLLAPRPAPSDDPDSFRSGSRKLWLNDKLCCDVSYCDSLEELIDRANTLNDCIEETGREKLEPEKVLAIAATVWKDAQAGKLLPMFKSRSQAKIDAFEEFFIETSLDDNSEIGDVQRFLLRLRSSHMARQKQGHTFALNINAMVRDRTMKVGKTGGWGKARYKRAIELLLRLGFLTKISEAVNTKSGRRSAQYALVRPEIVDEHGVVHKPLTVPAHLKVDAR